MERDDDASGSGLVIDAERGYILTTDHVLMGSSRVAVILADGRERMADQVRRDPSVDLAVLVLDPKGLNLSPAGWVDPRGLAAGDWVLAIGQQAAGELTLSAGILSGRRRVISSGPQPGPELIETDATISPAHAGGPLVNLKGEVVGICVLPTGPRGASGGMGYAIPADSARRFAGELVAFGRVRRAFVGVQIEPAPLSGREGGAAPTGVVVTSISAGTPAESAGLRPGDRITSAGGRPVRSVSLLQGLVEFAPIGEELILKIEREGKLLEVPVRPQARPPRSGLGPDGAVVDPRAGARRYQPAARPRECARAQRTHSGHAGAPAPGGAPKRRT